MAAFEPAPAVFFRPATGDDWEQICRIEAAGYPEDEAASPAQMRLRLEQAPDCFLAAQGPEGQVIGYVCGTRCSGTELTHESMAEHDGEGRTLCIHSVSVGAEWQRRGISTRMLRAYVAFVGGRDPPLERILLICKENLVPLYRKAGFAMVGPSSVVHGKDAWFEMRMDL